MNLINDQYCHSFDIISGLPTTTHTVPFFWSSNNEVSVGYSSHVWCDITGQFHDSVKEDRGLWVFNTTFNIYFSLSMAIRLIGGVN